MLPFSPRRTPWPLSWPRPPGSLINNYDYEALDGLAKSASEDPDIARVHFYDGQRKLLTKKHELSGTTERIEQEITFTGMRLGTVELLFSLHSAEAVTAELNRRIDQLVADEVRNLAMRAAEAARSTAGMIEGTVQKVTEGNSLVLATSEEFSAITGRAGRIVALISEIAAASAEQTGGIDHINQAMAAMDKITQENAANAEETAAVAEEMKSQADGIRAVAEELAGLVGLPAQAR